jgi:hypothetical protein
MMGDFLTFLDTHRGGILMLMVCLAFVAIVVQWVAWIFSIGRFRRTEMPATGRQQNLRYIFAQIAVKIINDFRHFLALVIVLIFALALAYAMLQAGSTMNDMKDALQAVAATLGGLVGSIVGYYFGESAATRAREQESPPVSAEPETPPQEVQRPEMPTIREAPRPE